MWQYVGTWWKHSGIGFVVNSQSLTLYRFQSSSTQKSGDLLGEYLSEKPKIYQIYTFTLGVVVLQIFFTPTWGNPPIWLTFFNMGRFLKQNYCGHVDRFVSSCWGYHFVTTSHLPMVPVTAQQARQKNIILGPRAKILLHPGNFSHGTPPKWKVFLFNWVIFRSYVNFRGSFWGRKSQTFWKNARIHPLISGWGWYQPQFLPKKTGCL